MNSTAAPHDVNLRVDYPERELDRLTTLFRVLMIVPIVVILALMIGVERSDDGPGGYKYQLATGGLLILPTLLMIVFRRKYPRWWYDFNVGLVRFACRVAAYMMLLRDEYPSTDDEQAVHVEIPYPDVENDLERFLPLVKWILVIPHLLVLWLLSVLSLLATWVAWFAVLINGTYPKDLFRFQEGVLRWYVRVIAYALIMTTDRYPPFTLSE